MPESRCGDYNGIAAAVIIRRGYAIARQRRVRDNGISKRGFPELSKRIRELLARLLVCVVAFMLECARDALKTRLADI